MKNKLINKRGITLIALVITIIVLLILAGISISMVSSQDGILNKATGAKETQEKAIEVEKVKLAVQASMMNEIGTVNKEELNKQLEKLGYDSINNLPADIEINGKKYTITNNGEVIKTLKVGDEVIYQRESFYVIGFSDDNTKVNLLAKYNLKADRISQDTEGNTNSYIFSSINGWSDETNYPLNLNDYGNLNGYEMLEGLIFAKRYGELLGATGRFMTVEEVEKLGGSIEDNSTSKCPDFINSQDFWLGSAYNSERVWMVIGKSKDLGYSDYYVDNRYGLRPVLEVLASSIN